MTAAPPPASDQAQGQAPGKVVAIASGKGGVGKTWLAITLAHAWAAAGLRVLLCDGDLGLANIDVQLGLRPAGDLGDVVAGRLSLEQAVACHAGGFSFLPGRSGSGALSTLPPEMLGELLAALRKLTARFDRVILDLGAGLDLSLRRMAVFADTLVVVVTDEPTSLTDGYAVLKLYAADRRDAKEPDSTGAARVVVNQAETMAQGRRTYGSLARACSTFLGGAPSLAGVVRRDPQVRAAIRRQTALLDHAPACSAAQDVAVLCRAL